MDAPTIRACLAAAVRAGGPLPDLCLRLLRAWPGLTTDLRVDDSGAWLLGRLAPDADALASIDLRRACRAAVALVDSGVRDPDTGLVAVSSDLAGLLPALEARALGDNRSWVPAARCHALVSAARERSARVNLSQQDLPFTVPGEVDALQVDVLAAGERVMPALHVDWVRKLGAHATDALLLDLRAVGGWFLPLVRIIEADRLIRALTALDGARRMVPGSRGLRSAYLGLLGVDAPLAADSHPVDALVCNLVLAAHR
jgi:hypothetical protein